MSVDPTDALLLQSVSGRLERLSPPFAVAVSGGGDSMALLHLAHAARPADLHAVTVNHGLRPEAADEAAMVAAFCAARGIPHATLQWTGPGVTGNLMDQARQARMALMADWARGRGIADILLAHTADDQAETFLMNLARGSGLDGLAGLRADWSQDGIRWHRPLLSCQRPQLRGYLERKGIVWAEDPTNDNPAFTRTRARRALRALRPLGLTVERLADTAISLASSRNALQRIVAQKAALLIAERAGAAMFDPRALSKEPDDLQRRLLIALLRWIGGATHPPREAQLTCLCAAVLSRRDATLSGVRFRHRDGVTTASRELRAIRPGDPWDGRWHITGPGGGEVRALGAGLKHLPDWRATGLSRQVLEVTPGIWQGDRLIAAPVAGWPQGWQANLTRDLMAIILAH